MCPNTLINPLAHKSIAFYIYKMGMIILSLPVTQYCYEDWIIIESSLHPLSTVELCERY